MDVIASYCTPVYIKGNPSTYEIQSGLAPIFSLVFSLRAFQLVPTAPDTTSHPTRYINGRIYILFALRLVYQRTAILHLVAPCSLVSQWSHFLVAIRLKVSVSPPADVVRL